MIQAELHGKLPSQYERWEDVLTSNVFGFFKYSDRLLFLRELLSFLGVNCSSSELQSAEFRFWPTFGDGTEPDVVIDMSSHMIVIESKYFSGFSPEHGEQAGQLIREVEQGGLEAGSRNLVVVAITADTLPPTPLLDSIPRKIRSTVKWINWQAITRLLLSIGGISREIPDRERLFVDDLVALLERKHLRGFGSFDHLPQCSEFRSDTMFFDPQTARFRGAFLGFRNAFSELEQITWTQTHLWFRKCYFNRMGRSPEPPIDSDLFFTRR